jgi:hypothetical protein
MDLYTAVKAAHFLENPSKTAKKIPNNIQAEGLRVRACGIAKAMHEACDDVPPDSDVTKAFYRLFQMHTSTTLDEHICIFLCLYVFACMLVFMYLCPCLSIYVRVV